LNIDPVNVWNKRSLVDLLHAYSKHCGGNSIAGMTRGAERSRRSSPSEHVVKTARRLRASEVDHLVDRYQAIGDVAELAREFGVTRQTISAHLASRGIKTVRRMTVEDIATAANLYRDGRSAASIGQQLKFDGQTVLNGLRRTGVQIRKRTGYSPVPSPRRSGADSVP
jgi:DNA-binding transcriptional ArsR family regulator